MPVMLTSAILAVPTSSGKIDRQRAFPLRIWSYVTRAAAKLGISGADVSLLGLVLLAVLFSARRTLRKALLREVSFAPEDGPHDAAVSSYRSRKPKPKLPAGLDCDLQRPLGDGAFAVVWLASLKGEQRAIKLIHTSLENEEDQRCGKLAEIECGKRLRSSELVVRLFDIFQDDRVNALVLEYLPGGELFDHMSKVHYYTEDCARACFRRIVHGVHEMHSLGVVHRDLKPENLLLAHRVDVTHPVSEVPVKIADLGMAYLEEHPWEERSILGTPGFLAPEMARGELHSRACDVFSLGGILFSMLVGELPWDDTTIDNLSYKSHSDQDLLALPELQLDTWVHLSIDAQDLVLQMLRQDPKMRPTTDSILTHKWMVQSDPVPRHLSSQVRIASQLTRRRMKKVANAARAIGRMAVLSKRLKKSHTD